MDESEFYHDDRKKRDEADYPDYIDIEPDDSFSDILKKIWEKGKRDPKNLEVV